MEIHLHMHVNTLFNEGEQEKKQRRWDKSVTRDLFDGNAGL